MQRVESKGLLFGAEPDSEYPVCSVPLERSDYLLLYADGVTETENADGEPLGDMQLERVVRNNRLQPASDLWRQGLSELHRWRLAAVLKLDLALRVSNPALTEYGRVARHPPGVAVGCA